MIRLRSAAASALLLASCATEHGTGPVDMPPGPLDPWLQVTPMSSAPIDQSQALTRIAFGSCIKQQDDLSMFEVIARRQPQLAVLVGDNVYGDVRDLSDSNLTELVSAYQTLEMRDEFTEFREDIPLLTIWDDHDYGLNDEGGAYPRKFETEKVFEEAWALSSNDPRRARDGVYASSFYGPQGQRVQIILLDTRFFRSQLTATDEKGAPGKERYVPSTDPNQTMLGADQEEWFAKMLKQPADLRIIVSSIQVIAEGHGWEAWKTLPEARERFYQTIEDSGEDNIILVSGDRHLGGLYKDDPADFPLFELTTSSINAPQSTWRKESGNTYVEPGPKRLGVPVYEANFGEIAIDWQAKTANLAIIDEAGQVVRSVDVDF